MDKFIADVAFAARQLKKRWGVSLVVVLSISIGVSANTAVFGWIDSIIINPLPAVPQSDRVVVVSSRTASGELIPMSYPDYRDQRDASRSFEGLVAFQDGSFSLEHGGSTRRAWAMFVSGNFFEVLGVAPAAGRFFSSGDQIDVPGGPALAVISHRTWLRHFDGTASAIGSTLILNGRTYTVSGVAPPGFQGTVVGLRFEVWVPLLQRDSLMGGDGAWQEGRKHRMINVMGRLRSGVDLRAAQAELSLVASRLEHENPDENAGIGALVLRFSEAPYGAQSLLSDALKAMFLGSLVVLLIVCANLVNLLLVRTTERQKEFGIRVALGAGRTKLVRQILIEGLLLGLLAALLSIGLAYLLSGLLRFLVPDLDLPIALEPHLDGSMIVYAVVLVVALSLVTSLLPALRAARVDAAQVLTGSMRVEYIARGEQRVQMGLVVAQIALAFVALSSAALFVKSFQRMSEVNPGFLPRPVLLAALAAARPGTGSADMAGYVERVRQETGRLPGVRTAAYAEWVPLGLHGGSWEDLQVQGYAPAQDENMKIYRNLVSPDYFEAMGIELLSGRDFSVRDDRDSADVAIVNAEFVRRYFGDRDPLGLRIAGWGRVITIVGVVRDSRYASLSEPSRPYFYVPFQQFAGPDSSIVLHIAVAGAPERIAEAVRAAADVAGAEGYVTWTKPLSRYIQASLFGQRLTAMIMSVLGAVAMFLAALGIYGMMSYAAARRVNEMGVRMALGASKSAVAGLVVGRGLRLIAAGLALGAICAALLRPLLQGMLVGASGADLWVYLAVGGMLALIALAACFIPGIRIGRLEPVRALSG